MKSGSIDLTILKWEGIQGGLVRYTLDREVRGLNPKVCGLNPEVCGLNPEVCGLNPIKHASMSTWQEIGKYTTSGVNKKR